MPYKTLRMGARIAHDSQDHYFVIWEDAVTANDYAVSAEAHSEQTATKIRDALNLAEQSGT